MRCPQFLIYGTLLSLATLIGCAAPRPPETALSGVNPDDLSDSAFQVYVNRVPLVTVAEAYRSMLILADGKDGRDSFEERRAELENRGIVRPAWGLQPENVIDTASVSYMVCKVCEMPGGINQVLFGSWGLGDRRSAMRELMFRGMIEDSIEYEYVTGSALFALMRNADAHMKKKGLYQSDVDLSDETDRDSSGGLVVPDAPAPSNQNG